MYKSPEASKQGDNGLRRQRALLVAHETREEADPTLHIVAIQRFTAHTDALLQDN